MKRIQWVIGLISIVLTTAYPLAARADATQIRPITNTPAQQVTATIMHLEPASYPWGGAAFNSCSSPEKLIGKMTVFPIYNVGGAGGFPQTAVPYAGGSLVVYYCQETFWTSDPYYQNFKSTRWVQAAAGNPYCYGSSIVPAFAEVCSMLEQKPPLIGFTFNFPPAMRIGGAGGVHLWPGETWNINVTGSSGAVYMFWYTLPLPTTGAAPQAAFWLDTWPPTGSYPLGYYNAGNTINIQASAWAMNESNDTRGFSCYASVIPAFNTLGKWCTMTCAGGVPQWNKPGYPINQWSLVGTLDCQ